MKELIDEMKEWRLLSWVILPCGSVLCLYDISVLKVVCCGDVLIYQLMPPACCTLVT